MDLNYPVIGYCKTKGGAYVPILDIHLMSDEEERQEANRQAVKHYIRQNGRTPHNIAAAHEWKDKYIAEQLGKMEVQNDEIPQI